MSFAYPRAMRRLINELSKLPSVGEKSATRLAYHLLTKGRDNALPLADAIREACEVTTLCPVCFALTEGDECDICQDDARSSETLCVVEKPADVIAIERVGRYRGRYHVLHGLWSPLKGVQPEDTKIGNLLDRLRTSHQTDNGHHPVKEIVLATSATVEGDATALYIANSVTELGISVTRLAQGLPQGGELEYADDLTLTHAFDGRRAL